jgi:molybdenum cofactor synthesis domain-containing protein
LRDWGFDVVAHLVVPDDVDEIQQAFRKVLAERVRLIITTGGTGPTPMDVTPEAVSPMLQRQIPGIAERIRAANVDKVPTAILSRGVAGIIGDTLVITLPGSTGGVKDGLAVLQPIIDHIIDQIGGGDHRRGGGV